MAKRGRPPKNPLPPIPWYKKTWTKIVAIVAPLITILGYIINFLSASADVPSGIENWFSWTGYSLEKTEKGSIKNCTFPKKFQKDTLYVLIARFEDNISTIESECYGRSLQARIDNIKHRKNIPIQACYDSSVVINTIDEAMRVQKKYNADVVFYGTIRNIEKSCMPGDVCFRNQLSDTLIHLAGGTVKVQDTKYEKDLSPEQIEMGEFHVNEKRFDTWLFTYFNAKIGKFNPKLYAIDEKLPRKERAKEYVQKGKLYYNLAKYKDASIYFSKAIELNPNYADTYFYRAISEDDLGKYQEAIKDYNKVIKLNPNYTIAYINRGSSKDKLGKYKEAIKDYDIAINLNPNNAFAYNNRGNSKDKLGKHKEAIEDYDIAIKLNPKNAFVYYNNRGSSNNNLGKYKEAMEDFDNAAQLNPNYSVTYFNHGISNNKLGKYPEAIMDYDKAIELDPNYSFAYQNKGVLKNKLGKYPEAIKDFDKAIQLNPKDPFAYIN